MAGEGWGPKNFRVSILAFIKLLIATTQTVAIEL